MLLSSKNLKMIFYLFRTRLELEIRRSKRHKVKYGVKLVRGAYLIQETALAAAKGYENPIWPNIEATHANYDACVRVLLENLPQAEVRRPLYIWVTVVLRH